MEEPGAFLAAVSVWQSRRLGVVATLVRLIKTSINGGWLCYAGCTHGWLSQSHAVRGGNGVVTAHLHRLLLVF